MPSSLTVDDGPCPQARRRASTSKAITFHAHHPTSPKHVVSSTRPLQRECLILTMIKPNKESNGQGLLPSPLLLRPLALIRLPFPSLPFLPSSRHSPQAMSSSHSSSLSSSSSTTTTLRRRLL